MAVASPLHRWPAAMLAVVALLLWSACPLYAAPVDIFVKIDGIEGEVTSVGRTGQILALGVNTGVQQAVTTGAGGLSGGQASFTDISIVKRIDKATPKLFVESASGTHFPKVTVEFVRDGAVFYKVTLSDVIISGVRTNAGSDGVTELVTFAFGRIAWLYTVYGPDGQPMGNVAGGWDLTQNKKA